MDGRCSCEKVKRSEWHNTEVSFENRSFYTLKVPMLFGRPIGLEKRIEILDMEIDTKNYQRADPPRILHRAGLFSGAVMSEIIPPNFFDSGIYHFGKQPLTSYVSSEPWGSLGLSISEAEKRFKTRGLPHGATYLWQTTCDKCRAVQGYQTVILVEARE